MKFTSHEGTSARLQMHKKIYTYKKMHGESLKNFHFAQILSTQISISFHNSKKRQLDKLSKFYFFLRILRNLLVKYLRFLLLFIEDDRASFV